jgi:hypothetical protein
MVHITLFRNAWMDEHLMIEWIHTVLKPWADEAPENTHPFVLLDSYCCHLTNPVKLTMSEAGVDYFHINGGCTGLCQLVDVSINKPFKVCIQRKWEQYVIEHRQEEVRGRIPSCSSRREVLSQWIVDSLGKLDEQLVRNAVRVSQQDL